MWWLEDCHASKLQSFAQHLSSKRNFVQMYIGAKQHFYLPPHLWFVFSTVLILFYSYYVLILILFSRYRFVLVRVLFLFCTCYCLSPFGSHFIFILFAFSIYSNFHSVLFYLYSIRLLFYLVLILLSLQFVLLLIQFCTSSVLLFFYSRP